MILPSPIIDMHAHLWGCPDGLSVRSADEDALVRMADRYGVEAIVVLPLFGGLYPAPAQIAAGNRAAADFARRDARMKPFVTVYPRHGAVAVEEARRYLCDEGFAGLKIWVSPADEPCVFPLIELTIAARKPALIHALHKSVGQLPLESDPVQVARLARRYPEATIIMAHFGGNFIYGCGAIRDTPNVLTDPSGTYCETGMLEYAVRLLGAERLLFGSDAPGADFLNNVAKVAATDLTDAQKHQIFYANARRLLS